MQLEKINAFSNFLSRPPKSYNEIAQFLAMNSLSEENVLSVCIGELTETGVVCGIGGFGWTSTEYASLPDLQIQAKFPMTDAIRTNKVIFLKNDATFEIDYPHAAENRTSVKWAYGVAIPVYPIGGMVIYSVNEIEQSHSMELFLVSIGSLLGLYASRLPTSLVEVAINVKQKIDLPATPLSDRQFVIAGLLERGFNNAQIADEIGFSESLVRQETVAIYRKLQVSGRKAMQAIRTLNLEAAANSEPVSEWSGAGTKI